MSLNDRVFASLSKILDEWAAACDEILLQARRIIPITCEAHAIQLPYWIKSSVGYHIYICMQIAEERSTDIWMAAEVDANLERELFMYARL